MTNGQETAVEPQVFNLIVYLIDNKDKIVTRDEILDSIWKERVVSDTSINNHIKSARKVLGDDGHKQQVIKTIHSRGYQFIADLESDSKQQDSLPIPVKSKTRFFLFYMGIFVLLVVGITWWLYKQQSQIDNTINQSNTLTSLAVLPLINLSPNKETDFLGFALTDQIVGKLIYNENIQVKPSALIRKFNQNDIDPIVIGQELNVHYILSGNYLKQNSDIRLNFELIDVKNKELIWRETQQQTYENLFQLQDKIANLIAQKLDLGLTSQEYSYNSYFQSQHSIDAFAYDLYLRSISLPFSKDGSTQAVEQLLKALAIEPDYAPIHLHLAKRFRSLKINGFTHGNGVQKAKEHLIKAIELNPTYFAALKNLSRIYYDTGEFLKSYKLAKKMLIINSNHRDTYFTLGKIYRKVGMVKQSIKMFEKSGSLGINTTIKNQIGFGYFQDSQYKKALSFFDIDTKNAPSIALQGGIFLQLGDKNKALKLFQRSAVLYPNTYWGRDAEIFIAIINNEKEKGLRLLATQESKTFGISEPTYYIASQYAAFGDKDNALRMYKKAVKDGYYNLPMMLLDPFFDFVRSDAKYIEIFNLAKQKHLTFKQAIADDL